MKNNVYADGAICVFGYDAIMFSDMYKGAHGFRPQGLGHVFASYDDFQAYIHYLVEISDESYFENVAYGLWIAQVHKSARLANASVGDIIRWQFEADGLNVNRKQDREMFCHGLGMSNAIAEVIRKTQWR